MSYFWLPQADQGMVENSVGCSLASLQQFFSANFRGHHILRTKSFKITAVVFMIWFKQPKPYSTVSSFYGKLSFLSLHLHRRSFSHFQCHHTFLFKVLGEIALFAEVSSSLHFQILWTTLAPKCMLPIGHSHMLHWWANYICRIIQSSPTALQRARSKALC